MPVMEMEVICSGAARRSSRRPQVTSNCRAVVGEGALVLIGRSLGDAE